METTPAIRKTKHKTRPSAGCRRGTAQSFEKRPAGFRPDGFLNHCFKPFSAVENRNYRETESEFFRSAKNLCELYKLALPEMAGLQFPQNVDYTYNYICHSLNKLEEKEECIIIRDEIHKATLATLKTYDTGQCLYYIPVKPLWRIAQIAQEQPLAEMLISVFAYLYQVADINYYRGNGSYLDCMYDTLDSWINEEMDDDQEQEYRDDQNNDLNELTYAGEQLRPLIANPIYLENFETNIQNYRKSENWDLETECLASEFLQLYRDYPQTSVFDNIHPDLFNQDEEERVRAWQYISFYWSGEDTLYEMLYEMVNNEFQEYGVTDEPMVIQLFDSQQTKPLNDLNFEKRLFELIDKLCVILNKYDHD
jgi:hypothetical protein